MLQTFQSGSGGRGQRLGVEGRVGFLRPSALGYECQEWISTPLLPLPRHISHLCPSSQIVFPSAPERGGYCSLQQAIPVDRSCQVQNNKKNMHIYRWHNCMYMHTCLSNMQNLCFTFITQYLALYHSSLINELKILSSKNFSTTKVFVKIICIWFI